jgi:hypothetical protein
VRHLQDEVSGRARKKRWLSGPASTLALEIMHGIFLGEGQTNAQNEDKGGITTEKKGFSRPTQLERVARRKTALQK